MIKNKEIFIAVVIIAVLSILAIPLLLDSDHAVYLEKSQQRLLDESDVIVICEAEQDGNHVNYRLVEVWRNRNNSKVDWAVGDHIRQLREQVDPESDHVEKKIVFYRPSLAGLIYFGSFNVRENNVYTKLNIGERNIISRLLDKPVSLNAFKQYVQKEL